jgi:hypothetical protein
MHARRARAWAAATLLGAAGFAHSSCGGSSPTKSTPPTTLAKPTPTPTPTNGLGDTFTDASCALGPGEVVVACSRKNAQLQAVYESALDTLIQQKPAIFDLHDEATPGSRTYKVLDKNAYMDGIVLSLRAAGLCAERDPDAALQDIVKLKNTNDFSEDYEVVDATGHARRGQGSYQQSCLPASFPLTRPQDAPPIGSGCNPPYPPVVTRFNCKIEIRSVEFYTLDATPIVGPNGAYCAEVGFTDGRTLCPIRPEGVDDRAACENWRVGNAKDTGRPGPTWTKADGSYCTGPASGCQNHPGSQYNVWTYVSGTYVATAENGANCTLSY